MLTAYGITDPGGVNRILLSCPLQSGLCVMIEGLN